MLHGRRTPQTLRGKPAVDGLGTIQRSSSTAALGLSRPFWDGARMAGCDTRPFPNARGLDHAGLIDQVGENL